MIPSGPKHAMQAVRFSWSDWFRLGGVFALCTIILFLGFYRNQWNVVREKKFKNFQLDSESLVLARLVESRQHGLFSDNGLMGWGDADPLDLNESDYAHQYDVFLGGGAFQSYSLYKSASGGQAFLFSILHQLSPYSPATDLRNFRVLVALLLATALALFITWVYFEFGLTTAIFVVLTTVVSQWIVLFGRNLFYFIWASFLPLGLTAWYLSEATWTRRSSERRFALVAGAAILFKCLMNGFDFIIPALAMPVVPVVYFAVRDRWHRAQIFRRLGLLLLALAIAVGLSLVILGMQLQVSEGSVANGFSSILSTLGRRTYADPQLFPSYAESLKANPWSVLWTYISEDTAIGLVGLRFLDLIVLLAVVTLVYLYFNLRWSTWVPDRDKSNALIAATWTSLLAPVSWFVLFKGQAFVHTHTNYLAWHMPFTLFGYAMAAWLVRCMIIALRRRYIPV